MEGVTTISQLLSMVDVLELQPIYADNTKYVSYHFERSGLKIQEDAEEKS